MKKFLLLIMAFGLLSQQAQSVRISDGSHQNFNLIKSQDNALDIAENSPISMKDLMSFQLMGDESPIIDNMAEHKFTDFNSDSHKLNGQDNIEMFKKPSLKKSDHYFKDGEIGNQGISQEYLINTQSPLQHRLSDYFLGSDIYDQNYQDDGKIDMEEGLAQTRHGFEDAEIGTPKTPPNSPISPIKHSWLH